MKAALCDLDGTLLDSLQHARRGGHAALLAISWLAREETEQTIQFDLLEISSIVCPT